MFTRSTKNGMSAATSLCVHSNVMRSMFTERMTAIDVAVADTADSVADAIASSTQAVVAGDLSLAESVIESRSQTSAQVALIEDQILGLVARQHPVAHDARHLVAALRLTAGVDAMATGAAGLSKIARSRYPEPAVPSAVRGVVVEMGDITVEMVRSVGTAITAGPSPAFDPLCGNLQQLQAEMMTILRSGAWPYGVGAAADIAGICHHYAQIARAAQSAVDGLDKRIGNNAFPLR